MKIKEIRHNDFYIKIFRINEISGNLLILWEKFDYSC